MFVHIEIAFSLLPGFFNALRGCPTQDTMEMRKIQVSQSEVRAIFWLRRLLIGQFTRSTGSEAIVRVLLMRTDIRVKKVTINEILSNDYCFAN